MLSLPYHALAQRISLFTVTISKRVGCLWKVMVLQHQLISIAVKKFRNAKPIKPFEIINDPNLSLFCWWSPCLLLTLWLTPKHGDSQPAVLDVGDLLVLLQTIPWMALGKSGPLRQNRQDMNMTSLIPSTMSLLLDVFPVETAKCPLGSTWMFYQLSWRMVKYIQYQKNYCSRQLRGRNQRWRSLRSSFPEKGM